MLGQGEQPHDEETAKAGEIEDKADKTSASADGESGKTSSPTFRECLRRSAIYMLSLAPVMVTYYTLLFVNGAMDMKFGWPFLGIVLKATMQTLLISTGYLIVVYFAKECVSLRRRQGESAVTEELDVVIINPGNESSAGEHAPLVADAMAPDIRSTI